MSITKRRILYIIFILGFIVITPIIFLYASGYTIKSGFKLQKTGMLIATTEPKGAKIYLNNKPQKFLFNNLFFRDKNYILTPAKIKNITPGKYEVRLELKDYWPWQKSLIIYPGQTTYLEDIKLFKKALPTVIQPAKNGQAVFSPNKKIIILIDNNAISLFDFKGKQLGYFIQSTSSPILINSDQEVVWSNSAKQVLIGRNIFKLEDWTNPLSLNLYIEKTASNLKWGQDNENIIYYLEQNNLYEFHIEEKIKKLIVAECFCFDYLPKNQVINLVIDQKGQIKPQAATNTPLNFIFLPESDYNFLNLKDDFLNLYDKRNKKLYIINQALPPVNIIQNIIDNIKTASWLDSKKILYANDFEIWLYDIKSSNQKLLTRISTEIKKVIWHPNKNYIIYITQKNISVLELDESGKHNITKIAEFEYIKNAEINLDGDIIYFYGSLKNQEGLYQLIL